MKRRSSSAIAFSLVCLIGFGLSQAFRGAGGYRNRAPAQESRSGFNFQALKGLIEESRTKGLDEIITKLPEDCLSHFALVRASRSIQYADDINPRVILYCDSARLLISYSTAPNEASYNTLEAIQFDDSTSTFRFKEIVFGDRPGKPPFINESPASCVECHRSSLRPNWDTYDLWPGVYGAEGDGSPIAIGSPEDKAFRSFLAAHDGRRDRIAPLIGLMKLSDVDASVYEGNYHPVPNVTNLNSSISKLNFQKIMAEMHALPDFGKYKFSILGAITGCDGIENFIPTALKSSATEPRFSSIDRDTRDSYRDYVISKFKRQGNFSRGPKDHPLPPLSADASAYDPAKEGINGYALPFVDPIASLRYVMALQNKDIESWFIARDEGSYNFDDGGYSESQLSALLADEVTASSPDVQKFFEIKFDRDIGIKYLQEHDKKAACASLQRKSLDALSGLTGNAEVPIRRQIDRTAPAMPHALNMCIECHSMNLDGIPSLPFIDPSALKSALNQTGYPRGTLIEEIKYRLNTNGTDHMPQGKYLDVTAKDQLEQYFERLAKP